MQEELKYGFSRNVDATRLARRVSWLLTTGRKQKASEELVCGMYRMGGVYIKFVQILSNLLPGFPGITPQIKSVIFDQAPVDFPLDLDAVLQAELPEVELMRFTKINRQPIGSGSFAVVYEATLDNSEDIIIKVLRPGMMRQLKTDMRNLRLLSYAAQPIIRSDLVNMREVYKDYRRTVMQEVDYMKEASNAVALAQQLKDDPGIKIPHTHTKLCTANILVQEKVDGLALSKLLELKESGVDPENYVMERLGSNLNLQLQNLGYSLLKSSIEGPHIYGDPHPGNIVLMRDDQLSIIDFGLLLPKFRSPFAISQVWEGDLAAALKEDVDIAEHTLKVFRLYSTKTFQALDRLALEMRSLDIMGEIRKLLSTLASPHIERIKKDYKSGLGIPGGSLLEAVNGANNRFAIAVDEPTARIARAFSQYWRAMMQLNIAHKVNAGVHLRMRAFMDQNPALIKDNLPPLSLEESAEIVVDWFGKLYERDPLLFEPIFAKIRESLHTNAKLTN